MGELAGSKELFEHRRDRLGVDQVVRHERLDFLEAHPLLDRALHADQAYAELVFKELSHGAYTAVPEVVDVVDRAVAVPKAQQISDDLENVLFAKHLDIQVDIQR